MKTYTKEEITNILGLHAKWLYGVDGGVKANLSYSDLRGLDLRGSNLSGANLSYSDLRGSDLRDSDLSDSNLRVSDLLGSDLRGSNLRGSNLRGSNLSGANLSDSNLRGSNLSYSDLSGANLSGANLSDSDLSYSDLRGSNLSGANLSDSNLRGSKTDKRYIQISCIGSKKRTTIYCFEDDIIRCGCQKLSLEEFENQVKNTHAENKQYLAEYLGFINYIKSLQK